MSGATVNVTTRLCRLCDDPIVVEARLKNTGTTRPSEQQPNPEGGTLDVVYTFEIPDPAPIYDHYRTKHPEVEL